MHAMRLYLINPSNQLVSIAKVKESRWNRYRVWKPLSLMMLAGLTLTEWLFTSLRTCPPLLWRTSRPSPTKS